MVNDDYENLSLACAAVLNGSYKRARERIASLSENFGSSYRDGGDSLLKTIEKMEEIDGRRK